MRINLKTTLLWGACLALLASCGGGHKAVVLAPVAGTAAFKGTLDAAKVARLAASAVPADATVSGTVKLTGLTLVNDGGVPQPGTGAFGSLLVWIVNPGDDILSATIKANPDAQGNFTLEIPNPPSRAVVAVNFKVQDDLNGDGTGNDTVSQRFAVALAPGKASMVSFDLKQQLGLQPAVPPVSGTAPKIIVTAISALDADGDHSVLRASDYTAKDTVTDVDGDGQFDPLRDMVLADANSDSVPDVSASLYSSALAYADVYGLVTRVDEFKRQADVLVKSGDTSVTVTVSIDPQAAVDLYIPASATPAGQFGQLNLGQFIVGRNVYADGYYTDGATQHAQATFAFTVLQ